MKKSMLSFVLVLSLILAHTSYAQDTPGQDSIATKKEKNFKISPLAAPGYTPELGAAIFAGGIMSISTDPSNSDLLRSSLPVTIGYTTTKAVVLNAILTSFWLDDKLRIYGDFWYKDMPDNYWGIGYENIINTTKSDSTTAYKRTWWWFNPRFLYQVKEHYFVGLNVDYNYTKGSDPSEGVANDENYQEFNDKPMNSGLGLILRYDSRDVPVDARTGFYIDLMATFYSTSFGGDNNYNVYLLDYRQFETINRPGQTLAWQIKARVADGEVPYGEMSQLGTPFDLRGYIWGRFRDNNMLFTIVEYRHSFLKKDGSLSKHGAVAWVGTGTIFENQLLKDNDLNWLPNFGVGYRFELQPRMNLRFDIGIGRESSGIYFNFNQAF